MKRLTPNKTEYSRSLQFKRMYIYFESHRLSEIEVLTVEERNKFLKLRDTDERTIDLLVAILEEINKYV